MKANTWISMAATGAALLLAGVPASAWSQTAEDSSAILHTDSSRARIAPGAAMSIYLYGSYKGNLGNPAASLKAAQVTYHPDGKVYDDKGRAVGKLVDSGGRSIASPKVNGDYRLLGVEGQEIGTTVAPSAGTARSVTLQPSGTGWTTLAATPANNVPSKVAADQGGTTTGSAISSSIRAGVGGGLDETDQNTSTGTSSIRDPNAHTAPSGPIYNGENGSATFPSQPTTPPPQPAPAPIPGQASG